jgi:hypothetical protein
MLCVIAVQPAAAADTGSISGIAFDQSGEPVRDAVVTVSGSTMPGTRVVQTSANGVYRVEYLLPGEYTVVIEKTGLGRSTRPAIVEVGRDTQLDFVIGLAVTEALVVTAANPIVDVRSTQVSFNVQAAALANLPLERTYRGLFQLIPGVADNRSTIGPAAGGGRQDNVYLIDGANITNPGFGYLGTEVNALDIAEVNLIRAGITAEFGRAAGSVTNAVSRSGSNLFTGMGRVDWLPQQLVAGYKLPDPLLAAGVRPGTFRDPLLTTEAAPALGIGGPLLRDRLFFYGSARYSRAMKWERINKVGTPLPDETQRSREFYGKLTGVPAAGHQVNVSYRHRPKAVANFGLDSNTSPEVATNTDNGSRIGSAEWAYFMSAARSVSARYLYMRQGNEDTPVRSLGYLPPFDPSNLRSMGLYSDPQQADLRVGADQYANIQNYRRHEIRGTVTQLFEIGRSSHALKAGAGYELGEEMLNRLANGWGSIVNITVSGVPALRARYYTPQAAQVGQGRTYSLFVQDDVALGTRVSANAGVLLNRDDFAQNVGGSGGCPATVILKGGAALYESRGDTCTFLRFGFTDEVQPRLGVTYQVREDQGDKAYANWGRYYNMDQKSSARSLAPSRLFQTQTVFDLSGAVLSSGPLTSTTGKMIDPDIKPIYSNEFVIGYATPFAGNYGLDVFFMHRSMHNFIEDVPSRMNGTAPDSGPFVAANLPCVRFVACQAADARRTYKAVTFDVRRRLTRGWTTDVSYTWSRFEGNFDIDSSTSTSFNTSSFIQDGPGTNVEDPNRFGPMFEDRPHVFKAFTSFAASSRLTLSGYLRTQSGAPWAARARDWAGGNLNFLEPAGSHRNPTWTNLDLMGSYRVPLGGNTAVTFEARLLNVFDNQTRLTTDAQQYLDLRTIPTPPYFAPYALPNPFFGTGNAFGPPRRLQLAAAVSF